MRKAIIHCSCTLLLLLLFVGCGSDEPESTSTSLTAAAPTMSIPTPTPTTIPSPIPTAIPTPTPTPDIYVLLNELAIEFGTTFADKRWATHYQLYPPSFQEKCPAKDFIELMLFFEVFGEMPDNMTFMIESVRIEGNTGYVEARFENEGVAWSEESEEEAEPFAYWKDGQWVLANWLAAENEEKPCEISFE